MENQSLSIAKIILEQIRYADKWALGAWGAKNYIAIEESKEFQGGIRFNVNGLRHKGIVQIELRWVDDYTISFISKKGDMIKKIESIYCDMLVDVLDWIEGKD